MEQVDIRVNNEIMKVRKGIKLHEIAKDLNTKREATIVGAIVENRAENLNYIVDSPIDVQWIDLSSERGTRIYSRSLSFVFIRAVKELLPKSVVVVEHSMSKGLYCEIKGIALTANIIRDIEKRMREIIAKDEPIRKTSLRRIEAMELFRREGRNDIVERLRYSYKDEEYVYKSGSFYDWFDGNIVPTTGYLKIFDIKFHFPGVVLLFPLAGDPKKIPYFVPQPKLLHIFRESTHWGGILGVDTVAGLNESIVDDKIKLLVQVTEALHEKKIASIADEITNRKADGNIILIAGPSSSGKTTFARRLGVQLMVNGLNPVSISVDDYFVDREKTPKDEFGNYDFESIDALDIELLNEHLIQLIQGEEIEMPKFDFRTGKRLPHGRKLKIKNNQPVIIEGIHGLNERMTYSIPKDHKFKIYISALTQLNIDKHNRIHTTDTRKIRRLVRDAQFRGTDAHETLAMWASVRRGEDRNIFPFQEEADAMFNSSLVYEMSILRNLAIPLLVKISPDDDAYIEAQRLMRFLEYFLPMDANLVPSNSILKEFIG